MKSANFFNSKTAPIPSLRPDVEIIPIRDNGDAYLFFHDQRMYATQNLAIRREAGSLLSLFDGSKSINDLDEYLGNDLSKADLLDFIQFLDKSRLLDSPYFQNFAESKEMEYEQHPTHSSMIAGRSYPSDPDELIRHLDNAFSQFTPPGKKAGQPKALYAPHIDPSIAIHRYAEAFSSIKELKPKRVVVLATSHYAGWYPNLYEDHPFILVNKDFELPLGTIRYDRELIDKFKHQSEYGITSRDRAHRVEHSIELHLLFLSYLWEHKFTVVPFLVSGLQELLHMRDGRHGQLLDRFSALLSKEFAEDQETFFLISGDLAHIGRKFGDVDAAASMLKEVRSFDEQFLKYGSGNHPSRLLRLMSEDADPYRICGFPPLYTFLNIMPNLKGEVLNYDYWDQRERESAVTFGSILYS